MTPENGTVEIVRTEVVKYLGSHFKCLTMILSTNSLKLTFRKGVIMEILISISNPLSIGTSSQIS